jgi:hypothetical protein
MQFGHEEARVSNDLRGDAAAAKEDLFSVSAESKQRTKRPMNRFPNFLPDAAPDPTGSCRTGRL